MKLSLMAIAAIGAVFFSACALRQAQDDIGGGATPAMAAMPAPFESDTAPDDVAAGAYCRRTGGLVETRRAVYGTNGSQLLFLAGKRMFCQYTKKTNGSRIHILLSTLYTTKPTLAALAYILKPPPSGTCNGNPASCYCTQLGGSDQFGGTTGAGGGWYKKNGIDQTLEACVFPDESSIDSWGLTYHAHGIIRGTDLKEVMRYKYPGG